MSRDALLRGRYSAPGQFYLITTCTRERRPLFADATCARVVIGQMRTLHEDHLVSSLAWVLMPDHLHWLFALRHTGELSSVIKRLKGRSATALRLSIGPGPVWQRGYHDHALRHEEDLQAVARYIVANPLRAGLVRCVGDYPWWDAAWL
ncbi:transposase [Pseudomonas stutzeri]|uniref:Transposase n=1 Tax=Stutzerimonas stutzeri KOS6 TaxID=1218352 RepID=A0A061JQN9_STUST|nr:transposase [Stutzerimonas stutzeri]EWC40489.1 transposase [Stutzerimonas stutzeri KOS6]MBK3866284.1 transposase [Stutzerimonas stutzeri]